MKGTTKSKGQKDELDKFYTNEEVAKKLIKKVDNLYKDKRPKYLEPSAGSGNFSNNIKNCIAIDIKPENKNIRQGDFLEYDWKDISENDFLIVIGNPPFGESGKLALDFIKKASERADVISFILPKGFMKDTFINRIPKNFHLVNGKRGEELELNSFSFNGNDYKIPTVFQIWEKRDYERKLISKKSIKNDYIEFTTKDNADFRIQRVGGNAGIASLDLNKAITSNYFIKNISKMSNEELISIINNLKYETIEYTTGPKSLSKGELISTLLEELNG